MSKAKTVAQGLVLLLASLAVPFGLPLAWVVLLWSLTPVLTPLALSLVPVLMSLALLLVPVLPVLAVAGARWDSTPTTDQHGQGLTLRGDLPGWARWMQTLDDRLPGGTYEPTVAALLARVGRFWTSVYWIGWRNRAHGLRRVFGLPSTLQAYNERFHPVDGVAQGVRSDGSWYWARTLGPLRVVAGHRIYRLPGEVFLAVPTATVKRA